MVVKTILRFSCYCCYFHHHLHHHYPNYYFENLFNWRLFIELGQVLKSELLEIVEAGLYKMDALPVAQPIASEH